MAAFRRVYLKSDDFRVPRDDTPLTNEARAINTRDVVNLCADLERERNELLDALELVRDCASQEWQQADGKRMGATDNQGRRLWFISADIMDAVKAAICKPAKEPA